MERLPADDDGTTKVDKDDWHSVTDARKRKQIQDRLAQRTRRKRLREAKKNAERALQAPGVGSNHATHPVGRYTHGQLDVMSAPQHSSLALIPCTGRDIGGLPVLSSSSSRSLQPPSFSIEGALSLNLERPFPMTLIGALFVNGRLLGLPCSGTATSQSSVVSSDIPPALRPTRAQLTTVHYLFIDRFPFPKMRENLIDMSAIIDLEDFSRDLHLMPCFSITPGTVSWDPRGWKMEKPFAEKWGFLFY